MNFDKATKRVDKLIYPIDNKLILKNLRNDDNEDDKENQIKFGKINPCQN